MRHDSAFSPSLPWLGARLGFPCNGVQPFAAPERWWKVSVSGHLMDTEAVHPLTNYD